MQTLRINDEVFKVPDSFADITMQEYCKAFYGLTNTEKLDNEADKIIESKKNEAKVISRLLHKPDNYCLDLPYPIFSYLSKHFAFIYDIKSLDKGYKNSIELDNKRYFVPEPREFSLRQWIDVDVTTHEDNEDTYIQLLAIMLSERDDKGEIIPYDGKYQKKVKLLRDCPCDVGLSIVYHFFYKGEALRRNTMTCSRVLEVLNQFLLTTQSS